MNLKEFIEANPLYTEELMNEISKSKSCGSYPFMNIAQDYDIPYGVVLRYAEYFHTGDRRLSEAELYLLNIEGKKAIHNAVREYEQKCRN